MKLRNAGMTQQDRPHTTEAINKLWEAYHHAYDPETCRKDLEADFDRMRSLIYQSILELHKGPSS